MFRKQVILEKLGGYNESFARCEDFDLWSRVILISQVRNLPRSLVKYRYHPYSRMSDKLQEEYQNENRQIISRNINSVFGKGLLSDSEMNVLVGVKTDFQGWMIQPLLQVIKTVTREYAILHQSHTHSEDFRYTVARRYAWVGYKALSVKPFQAWKVFIDSIFRYPVIHVVVRWMLHYLNAKFVQPLLRAFQRPLNFPG